MFIVLPGRRKYMVRRDNPEGAPASIANATVTLSADSFPYTGNPITPGVTVVYDGVTLVVNTDYFVSYADNTNVGAGTVTITGTGNYVGSQVKTFQITSAAPSTGWDFDITKTTYVGGKSLGSAQSQLVAGYYKVFASGSSTAVASLGLVTSNFLVDRYGVVNVIPKDSNDEFHIANAESSTSTSSYAGALLCISSDGKKLYWMPNTGSSLAITQQNLSTAGDLTSVSSTLASGSVDIQSNTKCLQLSKDGMYAFIADTITSGGLKSVRIRRMSMATAFDISTLDTSNPLSITLPNESPYGTKIVNGFAISDNGLAAVISFVTQAGQNAFAKLTMTTAFDITTATFAGFFSLSNGSCYGVAISPDAKSLFTALASGNVLEYALSE